MQLAQFVPEEQRQNGVGAEAEVRGSQTFVESRQTLLLQRLGEAVGESFVQQTLRDNTFHFIIDMFSSCSLSDVQLFHHLCQGPSGSPLTKFN